MVLSDRTIRRLLEEGSIVAGPTTYPARCFDVRVRGGEIQVRAASKQAAG